MIFDKALDDISKIPDLEPRVMIDVFKGTRAESYLRVPQKSQQYGQMGYDGTFDDNKWVNILYENIKTLVDSKMHCLEDYLKEFEPFKEVLKIKPEEYLKQVEAAENPKEIEVLRDEVLDYRRKETKLKESIHESVQIGMFRINCKETLKYLLNKYSIL